MKKYILTLATMFIILILTACGTNNGNMGEDPITDPNEDPITDDNLNDHEDPVIDDNESNEDQTGNNDNESNDESTNPDENLMTETGIYNGQADPHTIEIETDEGPTAFQLTMEARDDIEALIEGEEVTYTYTEDGDTRTIESVQMSE